MTWMMAQRTPSTNLQKKQNRKECLIDEMVGLHQEEHPKQVKESDPAPPLHSALVKHLGCSVKCWTLQYKRDMDILEQVQ